MAEKTVPVFRAMDELVLIGTMAIYDSQVAVSEGVPQQWRAFRSSHPELDERSAFYGASPCTGDRKIHYLTGVPEEGPVGSAGGKRLQLAAGEYAVVRVDDAAQLRDTWSWLLGVWLPGSGRREKNAPEFERFSGISEAGLPVGPTEVWIPLEPLLTR